ncbi:molybdopterin synthase sulfur carrier subunit [Lampris incognitus]|uniref:molybdopterin synthase sulfur carrier subunit n=1 Tax=Lampris incognitus TaxID=2546036 RepID=UPI0024B59B9E|nr:molybdopterin synthase sulfur carrier subunit [Lampris incognitus]
MNVQVNVLYFAKSAELAGVKSERLTVPHQIVSRQLWQEIVRARPSLGVLQGQVVLAVRQQYVAIDSEQPIILQDGDEVAVVPPLSGG